MQPGEAQESAERDQLWANLRALRPHIEQMAAGALEPAETREQLTLLLAKIVLAELDYREREAET